ncbi:sulfite exporter TauE/SafE family protein [soil metagenome]
MTLIVELIATMFVVGVILGFVGSGGAGVLVALLTVAFGLNIHTAIGTALAAMCCLTISGAISHYREGNVAPRVALIVGLSGMLGAIIGAQFSAGIPEDTLQVISGLALWTLAFLVWLRARLSPVDGIADPKLAGRQPREAATSAGIGISGGVVSAIFGVGMTPYIQLGLLSTLKMPLRITIGTTMTALVFISAGGATALAGSGNISVKHLVGSVIGLSIGTFLGARLTRRLSPGILRRTILFVPIFAGAMLLFL